MSNSIPSLRGSHSTSASAGIRNLHRRHREGRDRRDLRAGSFRNPRFVRNFLQRRRFEVRELSRSARGLDLESGFPDRKADQLLPVGDEREGERRLQVSSFPIGSFQAANELL